MPKFAIAILVLLASCHMKIGMPAMEDAAYSVAVQATRSAWVELPMALSVSCDRGLHSLMVYEADGPDDFFQHCYSCAIEEENRNRCYGRFASACYHNRPDGLLKMGETPTIIIAEGVRNRIPFASFLGLVAHETAHYLSECQLGAVDAPHRNGAIWGRSDSVIDNAQIIIGR